MRLTSWLDWVKANFKMRNLTGGGQICVNDVCRVVGGRVAASRPAQKSVSHGYC